jgi:hypothetical protein
MNWRMKERFLLMGGIISVIGLGLIVVRGSELAYEGFFGLGLILLVLGVFWKKA